MSWRQAIIQASAESQRRATTNHTRQRDLTTAGKQLSFDGLRTRKSLREFTSKDPEKILANINVLHRKMLESMNAKKLDDAAEDLSAEVAQYKVVVTQFKKLGFPELSLNAGQKRELLMNSLHKLRETMHAIRYQEHRDLVVSAKKNGEFKVVRQHLVEMQNITRAQQKVEKEGKDKDHGKKLAGILAELDENMALNDFFIEYKDLEGSYNKARDAVTRGSYREAHEVASQRIPRVQRLHERLKGSSLRNRIFKSSSTTS